MKKFKKFLLLIICVISIILNIILLSSNTNARHNLAYEKATPDVELYNYLSLNSGIFSGSATGFVAFNNPEDQPKNLKQYINIEAIDSFDDSGNQFFAYQDIIKMDMLPPKYFEPVPVVIIDEQSPFVTLSDIDGNMMIIDSKTMSINLLDATKDKTKLITSYTEMIDYLMNN